MKSHSAIFCELLSLGRHMPEARRLMGLFLMTKHPSTARSLAAVAAADWKHHQIDA